MPPEEADYLAWTHAIKAGMVSSDEAAQSIIEGKPCPFVVLPEARPESILGTTWRHRKSGKVETITPKHLATRKARMATDAFLRNSTKLEDPRSEALIGTTWKHLSTGNVITFAAHDVATFAGRQRAWKIVEKAVMLNEDGSEAETNEAQL